MLFARWYPYVLGLSEKAGQSATRADLLAGASGRTLEIGAGHGINLAHYTARVSRLVVSEPSRHMQTHLRRMLTGDTRPPVGAWDLVQCGAEDLPFADDSFDTVCACYVHCTITDPARALREIARVLRPGGSYLFLEHVLDPEHRMVARAQQVLDRPHTWIAAGCHPNRRTEQLLAQSPLQVTELVRGRMPRSSPTVRPTIRGTAIVPVR